MSSTNARNIPFGRPWITNKDREAVLRVLDGPILTHGPVCHEFENAFSEIIYFPKLFTFFLKMLGL